MKQKRLVFWLALVLIVSLLVPPWTPARGKDRWLSHSGIGRIDHGWLS